MKNGFLIHGGTRRTATATLFVHEEPRRDTKNCRTATPFVHEGTRRDTENCNCNTFCPRRATEDHGELQLHHLLSTKGRGGTRRTAELHHLLSTKGHGGPRRTATAPPFVHEGTRRDHGELQLHHLLSTKGRGGTRRTATATPFVHEGMRGTTKKTFFCPRWAAKNSFLIHEGL